MSDRDDEAVATLQARADELRFRLQYAPRAFVMEFAGTPKSGKSTSVEAVRHFFSRYGFRVHVLSERAAVCPIPMKGHLFFNTWCACSMLAELLANVETETDLVIVDWGLFDALVWLTLQERRGELSASEARVIEGFLLLERWRTLIDLAVVMSVEAEEALARENSQRITNKGGSIMNPEALTAITQSVEDAIGLYGSKFGGVIHHKTTGQNVKQSNVELAGKVLDHLEGFLDPEILVVSRREMESLPLEGGGSFDRSAFDRAIDSISKHGRFMRRAQAESDADYVQIVPGGVLRYETGVFLFQRRETDPKYRLYGKNSIWQGCHVSRREGAHVSDLIERALLERLAHSLFLSRVFPIKPLGYCWDRDDPSSSRHFGLIYQVEINNSHTAVDLRKKEFRKRRGHGWSGKFDEWSTLVEHLEQLNLESWSRAILHGVGVTS